ncbi:NagC family transcriptional regulator [Bifidobacterium aemilianum]|uniref:NagC family transcriptional regulator n=1 Tax=Bifidobacterium aemilianum TaxID=2493120 RepID=A0A366K819_9BIFI|nr:ROK family protein [Bifidobacterium aemilianum]RBP97308.1 NagC family transcriptional regulator [Bifidobacterium aemilianum]
MPSLKSINQDDLRNHNLSVVLDTLLQSAEPMSRAELAKSTGLTKATMSLLVPMLISGRVVREGQPNAATVYGRPSTPLMIAGGRMCGIGLQINTDGYGYMVLDLDGKTVSEQWVSQSMGEVRPEDIFGKLDRLVARGEREIKKKGYRVAGCGLALPGLVTEDMRLIKARNLGWEQLNLGEFDLVKRLDVHPDNEANMAALAQIPGYATRRMEGGVVGPSESFLYISTDIGIGGALVRRGQVERGDHGFAGELGHLSVSLDGPVCSCRRRGCVEAYAGRRALVESAGIASGSKAIRIEAAGELLKRWESGDNRAQEAVDKAVEALASVMVSAINVLDVDAVILGGIWERFGDGLARRIEDRVGPQLLVAPVARPRVLLPDIRVRPALRGAAEVGLRHFLDNPLTFLGQ